MNASVPTVPVVEIPFGRVFAKGVVIPVQPVGAAKNERTQKEEFYFGFHEQTMAPCVISVITDQIYVLDWSDVIALAIKTGVLVPKEPDAVPEMSRIILRS